MQRLTIEIPKELMKDLKIRVAKENISLKVFVTQSILKNLFEKEKKNNREKIC
jgi:hypothetical protein